MKAKLFPRISDQAVALAGHRLTLAFAISIVLAWCIVGWASDLPLQWHRLSSVIGTLLTLLLLILMQHAQNRDTRSLQLKLDELIRANEQAGNHWMGAERLEAEQLRRMAHDRERDHADC